MNGAAHIGAKRQAARLRWREMAPAASHVVEQLKLAGSPQYNLAQSIALAGIPEIPHASPLDEALALLETAAEFEHALLIEYLYAAFSVRDDYRKTLMLIAHQEMGHLITVQNLRLLCGAAPYMNRQDASPQPGLDPFPFRLEPLSLASLARYSLAEMPAEAAIPAALAPVIADMRDRVNGAGGAAVNRIGALYAKLYWLFMKDDTAVGPWSDFPAALFTQTDPGRHIPAFPNAQNNLQADSAEWQVGGGDMYIDLCGDRDAALRALQRLMAQGEGLSNLVDSHFELFVAAYQSASAGQLVALSLPVNPTTDVALRSGTVITHPVSAALSRLCDAIYAALTAEILLSLGIDKTGAGGPLRQDVILSALGGMHDVHWCASQLVGRLALDPAVPANEAPAAPAFMPVGASTGNRSELLASYGLAMSACDVELDRLAGEPQLHPVIRNHLASLRATVSQRRALKTKLAAL